MKIAVPATADGFNVWVPLPREAKAVAGDLAARGWLVRVGNAFDVQSQAQAIRVTVSHLQDGQAQRFAKDLNAIVAR